MRYSNLAVVLKVDFEKENAADGSGRLNNGVVTGSPDYVDSYDGSKAIYIKNVFGKQAGQYITFENLKGIDITRDDYTVMFWYKTVNGGNVEWAEAGYATTAGSGINMAAAQKGGVVYANQDMSNSTNSGMSAAQLTQTQYFAAGVTGQEGSHCDMDGIWQPQDSRWHQVAVVYDRDGACKVYVDDTLESSIDISAFKGQKLGINTLTLGADVLGQYGLGSACVDDFTIYASALEQTDIMANYYVGRLKALVHEAQLRVASVGAEYAKSDKDKMITEIKRVSSRLDQLTIAGYAEAITLYDQLKKAFDDFLLNPSTKASLTMLLLSDIHIEAVDDARAKALETIFADVGKLGITIDGIINAGDFANNSHYDTMQVAFDVMGGLLEKYGHMDWDMIAAFGNHEICYESVNEGYLTSTSVYWKNMQKYISSGSERVYGTGVLDEMYHEPGNHYCYGMTLNGSHFLVLNTDYMEQTGSSKKVSGIAGNELDPIRHGVHFDDETFVWIEKMLNRYNKDGRPIMVVNHFPFIDSVPLSYFREVIIEDNSIGRQDAEIRRLLARYNNVVYFCGHLHSALGMTGPVQVVSDEDNSFTEVNLASLKSCARAYRNIPANWIMFVYDTEIVLRARDFATREWLTAYDEVIPLLPSLF